MQRETEGSSLSHPPTLPLSLPLSLPLMCTLHIFIIIFTVGSVRVYDLESNKLLCHYKYSSGGNSLLWAPLSVDPNGLTLFTGHSDGVLR